MDASGFTAGQQTVENKDWVYGPLGHCRPRAMGCWAIAGRGLLGPRAFGLLGHSGPWAAGHWAAGLLLAKPLGVSPSKGNQGTTRGKEKILMALVGIEPTTSGLDLLLLCRLIYEVRQRKSGTIKVVNGGKEKVRVHMNVAFPLLGLTPSGYFMGFTWHFNLHFKVNCLFHHLC